MKHLKNQSIIWLATIFNFPQYCDESKAENIFFYLIVSLHYIFSSALYFRTFAFWNQSNYFENALQRWKPMRIDIALYQRKTRFQSLNSSV